MNETKERKSEMKEAKKPKVSVAVVDSTKEIVAKAVVRIDRISKRAMKAPTDAEELTVANVQWREIKDIVKHLKDSQTSILKPLKEAVAATNQFFTPTIRNAEALANEWKAGIEGYLTESQRLIEERRERLDAKVESGKITQATANRRTMETATELGVTDVPTTTVTEMEIVDREEVPAEYWTIDEVMLRRDAIAAFRAGRKMIPGVRITEKKVPVNR